MSDERYRPIVGEPGLVRDTETGKVIPVGEVEESARPEPPKDLKYTPPPKADRSLTNPEE